MTTETRSWIAGLSPRQPFSWLRERDIDLLVCAELHVNGTLTRLMADRIACPNGDFSGAWVSHTEIDGECDLIVAFNTKGGNVIALVENKITVFVNAPEHPGFHPTNIEGTANMAKAAHARKFKARRSIQRWFSIAVGG